MSTPAPRLPACPSALAPACPQDVKDKFMRLQADFDNFRKRTAAEKDSMRSAVRGDTVAELLPLVSE